MLEDPDYPQRLAQAGGWRGALGVPLLREGNVIGVICVMRSQPGRFSETQVALLQTFAAQAVIAIENVRLFTETKEALEQQTATSDILRVISSSPTALQPVLDALVRSAVRFCAADDASIQRLEGDTLLLVAHHGPIRASLRMRFPVRGTSSGRCVLERRPVHVPDLQAEADAFPEGSAIAREYGFHTILSVPLLGEGEPLGAIILRRTRVEPFSDKQIALLQTFADQAVIAIENVRLFTELQEKNQALTKAHAQVTEALEQQTATSEILRAISTSPTELEPVFHTIVDSAVRLCGALFGSIFRVEDEQIHLVAHHGLSAEALREFQRTYPVPLRGGGVLMARAITEARIIHTVDVEQDETVPAASRRLARATGYRAALVVPLLREGRAIGAMGISRREGAFSERQIELVRTFADQAVIAIENVRLFTELQEKYLTR